MPSYLVYQLQVMRQLLQTLDWTFLAVIYDDTSYGHGGLEGLQSAIKGLDICFPETIAIDSSSGYDNANIEHVIRTRILKDNSSLEDPPISGIVVFGSYLLAQAVLRVLEHDFTNTESLPALLFSESAVYIEGLFPNTSRGSFIPSPTRRDIQEFTEYEWTNMFVDKQILYETASTDRFFKDMYEQTFNCQLADSIANDNCSSISESDLHAAIPPSQYNQYAVQALGAMAYAIRKVFKSACNNDISVVCDRFEHTSETHRAEFIRALENTSSDQINFDKDFGNHLRLVVFQQPDDLTIYFKDSPEVVLGGSLVSRATYEVLNHKYNPDSHKTSLVRVCIGHTDTIIIIIINIIVSTTASSTSQCIHIVTLCILSSSSLFLLLL